MRVLRAVVVVAALVGLAGVCAAGDLEDQLESRLRGAWTVLRVEAYSDCAGTYFNSRVTDAGVAARSGRRFEVGELAKIDKINLKRARLDLYCSLAEPVLWSRIEGPFELYDERSCKVQLMVELPRELVKADDLEAILGRLDEVLELHRVRGDAEGSVLYNQRQREDYPPDYELTLARYQVWQAEQVNAAVATRIDGALDDATSIIDRMERDGDYLDGFAAGTEAMRSWYERDCDDLLAARIEHETKSPPSDRSDAWREGFLDGQAASFNLHLARRLGGCFVPVPAVPGR